MRRTVGLLALTLAVGIAIGVLGNQVLTAQASTHVPRQGPPSSRPSLPESQVADWPAYGRDPGGTRYSPLAQITRANVKQLRVAWLHHDRGVGTPCRRRIFVATIDGRLIAAGGSGKLQTKKGDSVVAFALP